VSHVRFTELCRNLATHADAGTLTRINDLIEEAKCTPFTGTGKLGSLRENLAGWWSRRITGEHRLIARVEGKGAAQALEIAQCRWHYR
jgi:toxin YoeB